MRALAQVLEALATLRRVTRSTFNKYNQDHCPMLAAALAFHSFFSIFPLLLFLIYLGTEVLAAQGVHELLSSGLILFLPTGGDTISEVITATVELRGPVGLVGFVGLIWNASSVFTVLETALNRIWKAKPRAYWRTRLIATASIFILAILFVTSVTFGQFLPRLLGMIETPGQQQFGSLLSFALVVVTIALLYAAFPNRKIATKAAVLAAAAAASALTIARTLFDLFINSAFVSYGSVYGSLAWIVSLALWAFVVATVFLAGAELGSVLEEDLAVR
jgi:membrane protein